jgi:hypothetical protein
MARRDYVFLTLLDISSSSSRYFFQPPFILISGGVLLTRAFGQESGQTALALSEKRDRADGETGGGDRPYLRDRLAWEMEPTGTCFAAGRVGGCAFGRTGKRWRCGHGRRQDTHLLRPPHNRPGVDRTRHPPMRRRVGAPSGRLHSPGCRDRPSVASSTA